mgnify:CR=1 FL=1
MRVAMPELSAEGAWDGTDWIDISRPLGPETPVWPGDRSLVFSHRHDGEMLITAAWPVDKGLRSEADEEQAAAVADILELVSQMRNARADAGIEPATWLEAEVRFEAAGHAEVFEAIADAISRLARVRPTVVAGESAVAEAGAMMYKDTSIEMHAVFGDGSQESTGGGFMDKLMGAGKRLLTGESLFITVFTHSGQGKAKVAFGAPYPGNIIPVNLKNRGGHLVCQKDCFLCAARGVSIGIAFQRKILTGLFGGEGFIMQKLEGDGQVFLHAGGTVVERTLEAGEVVRPPEA